MLILRLFQFLALWALAATVWAHAWMVSVAASAYDSRIRFGVLTCLGAWFAGTLLGALLSRGRSERWPALSLNRHVLALLVTALCVEALSHVAPDVSIRVLREEVPAFFGWIYPALCFVAPLLLRRTSTSHDLPAQLLITTVFVTAMSGAMFFLSPPAALGLALVTLGWQFDAGHSLPGRSRLLLLAAFTVLLISLASRIGYSRISAQPSESWLLAAAALGAAIAVRPRGERDWRQLLGVSVLAAVLVAACGATLTVWLGRAIAWEPALHSRLVLFRQHPNFLAPFFGLHAVLALALFLARPRRSLPWLGAALLLGVSAWLTDSRTGFAALLAAVAALALLPLLTRVLRSIRLPVLAATLAGVVVLLGGAWLGIGGDSVRAGLAARVGRFEKSLDFRLDAWRNSLAIIEAHPLIGIGPNTFLAVERFEPGSRFFNAPQAPHPHNVFLYVAQAAGLPALLLFLGWTVALFTRLLLRAAGKSHPEEAQACAVAASAGVPPWLLWGLVAGLAGLLAANLFDLGLALETVVPAPFVIFTGLAASTCSARAGATRRWQPLLAGVLLCAAFIPLVLSPLRARTDVEQAQLQSYDAGQIMSGAAATATARATLEEALDLDPATPRAHELLSRWLEDVPGGFTAARDVLQSCIALAPKAGEGHAMLARLFMRNALWPEAEAQFVLAMADTRGSLTTSQDLADRIVCLARQGRRDEALSALTDALRLDAGVMNRIAWTTTTTDNRLLAVGGSERQPPIELIDAVERVYQNHRADQEAGRPVGYAFWMDCYRSFRTLHRDDRASDVLDYMEQRVDVVEPFIFSAERGNLAFDAGRLDVALAEYTRAYELSGNAYYRTRAAQVQRMQGESVAAAENQASALDELIEILDQPYVFESALSAQFEAEARSGRPVEAARKLRVVLLFKDDPLERARLWERIGMLELRGGAPDEGEQALRASLELLASKPWPWRMLQEGTTDSMPARLARALCDSWRARGLNQAQRFKQAWSLPDFFSSRMGPSLFRLGFYQQNAQVDQLMRESDLQLLADRGNLLAHWARLVALEASGQHLKLGVAMRALVDQYATEASADLQWNALAAEMSQNAGRLSDPQAWFKLGLLSLLKGQYLTAIDWFGNARSNVVDDPAAAATYCGWKAQAAFLASKPERAREALSEGVLLDPDNEMLALRLSVIPEVLPPDTAPPPEAPSPTGRQDASR